MALLRPIAPPPSLDPRDAAILRAIGARRHDEAITLVRDAYGPALQRLALRIVRDPALAEDVVQDALLAIHQGLDGVRDGRCLRGWVMTVTAHRALDEIRRRARRRRHLSEGDLPHDVADEAAGPLDTLEDRRHLAMIEQRIDALPPRVRDSVLLRLRDGLTYEEAARILGERGDTVQVRVRRALVRLQGQLRRRGVERGAAGRGQRAVMSGGASL